MKQKNYDAEQMFKEYMQSVSADQTAIDDILSGERQPANHGARIKHSTGKMATVTAAAAVVAICAGIGLSNMNANDDSSVKSAAAQTTPAVSTASQTKKDAAAAPEQQQDNFKTEVTGMYASDHGLRVFVKCTALTDEGKKLVKEADEALKNNKLCQLSVTTVNNNTDKFAGASVKTLEINGDSFTTELTYQPNGSTYIFKDGTKLSIRVVTPAEYTDEKLVPSDRTVEFTVKKNMTERVFKSASGKTLWLSDFQFNCNADYRKLDKNAMSNFEMTFADGTVKTQKDLQCCGGSGTPGENGDPNAMIAFVDKIDSSKVVSIKYAGETFKTQDASVKLEAVPIFVTERAFGINLKLTADNEAGRKVLEENASQIVTSLKVEKDGMIATAGIFFGNDKLDGNTLNLRLYGNIFNKRIETVPVEISLPAETPDAVVKALGGNTSTTVYFKKTTEDKVFVNAATGDKFWLSDMVATTDHNYRTQKVPPVTFKLSDGTEISTREIGMGGGGNLGGGKISKQYSFFLEKKIDVSKVVSITYDGETFTAQ